ncbi:MAG: hypothetical protein CMP22_07725 [Rickettsiales bacterium]|nr:hypothetical protein [Rickettsiales bacterium]|tara:strand:- start:476 stop:919 length:444 start_codon:yes stop_codon:yes gene_type:complete
MENINDFAHDTAKRKFCTLLQLFIGRGRKYSVSIIAEATGISDRTIQSYVSGENAPTLMNALRLMEFLPTVFTNGVLELAGYTGAKKIDVEAENPHIVLCSILEQASSISKALQDGHIDHQEKAKLLQELPQIIAMLQGFHSGLKAS